MDWFFSSTLTTLRISILSFVSLVMSRELRICPGVGGRKCGAFLSSLDRDPHPTCTRCRGRICTKDLTCDVCKDWSPTQWEAFAKKRSYAERKRSARPSGSSLPPAPKSSPCTGTSSEVTHPAAPSSSSSLPSEGRVKKGEPWDAPCAASCVGLPLLPLDLVQREGWKCLWTLVRCAQARFCLLSSFGGWEIGSCSLAADPCCPLRSFLGCLSPLITARSARW